MDDLVSREMAQGSEYALQDRFDFMSFYFFATFEEFVQLLSLQILKDDINRIFGFVNSFQLHDI